ncbi:MAG: UvrD-helicase domain-containing protein [Dehalococcoidia bacterium]|nr:UvrD-helicase domain-containing protein [Dehalococcoidia bacterium]
MTVQIRHKAISASAGSGKTFQLAHRYIELMARGVEPDRIIALTFSRKAAGEIFDSVVRYLCQAASSPEAATRTAELIRKPGTGEREFLQILRGLLESLHRLHIGTLDSFTVGIAKTFPLELGIPPHFELLGEEGAAGGVRQEVLRRAFSHRGSDRAGPDSFLQAYKQATFGREEKGLEAQLDELIAQKRGCYQVLPEAEAWGRGERIWKDSSPWWKGRGDVKAAAERLLSLVESDAPPDNIMQRWRTFVEAVRRYGAGSTWSPAINYLFDRLSQNIGPLRAGNLSLKMDRVSQDLSREECELALTLMAHVVQTEIGVALQRTQGIYAVLDFYEGFYDAMMRSQGRLTFTDVQYLLTAGNRASRGALISRRPSAEARLYIDYRLDCKLDHWLLDEFQDTSDLQWEVLRNLADEILQDPSGRRSFFYVGDTKQAIYGWRGGNARLFSQILDRYGQSIEVSRLNTSFRSCQAVIDMVNAVFGRMPADLPAGAVAQWQRSWEQHECEMGAVPADGYAAVIEPDSDGGNVKPEPEDRYRVVARILQEIDPLSRGLSAAVLVRSNKSGEEIADYLRRECPGMRIIHEGRAFIRDNPVVSVLLALVQFAAHPGDTYAWRHLEMSPLRRYFISQGLNRNNLPLMLLRELQSGGFQAVVRQWGSRLDAACPLDGFGRKRLAELTNAAIEFDRTGSRDCNAFLRFMEEYEIHDLAASEAVRVMTIHQSKGLGFDVVILPDLQDGNMTGGGQPGLVLARDPELGRPLWALQMPRRIVAESDDVLRGQVKAADETAAFDALCLLYVAMTRARQGLYIITSFPGKGAQVVTPAAFVKRQLTGDPKPVTGSSVRIGDERAVCLYETGNPGWYIRGPEVAPPPRAAAAELPPDFSRRPSLRPRLVRVQPSRRPETAQPAGSLFAPDAHDARDLGTAVHQLFEKLTWIGEAGLEELTTGWSAASALREDLKLKAIDIFRQAVAADEIRAILTRPAESVALWREKRFEIVIDRRWVSGAFDRVAIVRNQKGKAVGATVFDFKTDEVTDEGALKALAAQYRSQMDIYRTALARMLGLQKAKVAVKLVFVCCGRVLSVDR